jgi:hypothetical protein
MPDKLLSAVRIVVDSFPVEALGSFHTVHTTPRHKGYLGLHTDLYTMQS